MRIAGVIIAGGQSARMGGNEKAFLSVEGVPLIQHVIERIRPQVDMLAINANGNADRFDCFGLPVIADRLASGTPLAGIEAALRWGMQQGAELVLTVPSDAPNLPSDLVQRLAQIAPAIAASGGQAHYITGVWTVGLHDRLANAIMQNGLRAVKDFVRLANASQVTWSAKDPDPFLNLNTPDDVKAFLHQREQNAPT